MAGTIGTHKGSTLKEILEFNVLDSLINNNSSSNNNSNNNNNNNNSSSSSDNKIYNNYLKIILNLLIQSNKKEIVQSTINEFLNKNKDQLESLFNQLSTGCSSQLSSKEKERKVLEFIIMYGDDSIYLSNLFYEFYGIYYIGQLNEEIEANISGGSGDGSCGIEMNEKREDEVLNLVKNKLNNQSILESLQLIVTGYFSIKALELLNSNSNQVKIKSEINDWKGIKNLSLTSVHIKKFIKLFSNDFTSMLSQVILWAESFYKAIATGDILDFGKMSTDDIIDLFNYLSSIFNKKLYNFNQVLFRFNHDELKRINPTVWMLIFANIQVLPHLTDEQADIFLTVPFKIDSKQVIDFLFDNYSKFRLVPQIIQFNKGIDDSVDEARYEEEGDDEDQILLEYVQHFKISTFELAEYFYNRIVKLRDTCSYNKVQLESGDISFGGGGGGSILKIGGGFNQHDLSYIFDDSSDSNLDGFNYHNNGINGDGINETGSSDGTSNENSEIGMDSSSNSGYIDSSLDDLDSLISLDDGTLSGHYSGSDCAGALRHYLDALRARKKALENNGVKKEARDKTAIAENRKDNYLIKKEHIYYYLYTKSIKNCDIETIKRVDELGMEFTLKEEDRYDNGLVYSERPIPKRNSNYHYSSIRYNNSNNNQLDNSNNNNNNNNNLKHYKLYNDKSSREQLLIYLSSNGFKSISLPLFNKMFGRLLYQVDSTAIEMEDHHNHNDDDDDDDDKEILKSTSTLEEFRILTDKEIQDNGSLIDLNSNQVLLYKLILDSIYKLNYQLLNILLSRFKSHSISSSGSSGSSGISSGSNHIQINKELFLNLLNKDIKLYTLMVKYNTFTNYHQFKNIFKIIQLVLSKFQSLLPNINHIFKYLYKAIIQSSDCTLDQIQMVNQLYQDHSLKIDVDYFNLFYWCHNKSRRLSFYFISLYHCKKESLIVPEYFKHLTQAAKGSSKNLIHHILGDMDFEKFNFNLIVNSTFNQVLEQLGRIKMFTKVPSYYISIQRYDLYIKTLKQLLGSKECESWINIHNITSIFKQMSYSLDVFFLLCSDANMIKEVFELHIKGFNHQKLLDISVLKDSFILFKYAVDSFKDDQHGNPSFNFYLLLQFGNLPFLEYLIEHLMDQLKEYFSTLHDLSRISWFDNIEFAKLLMKHFPNTFVIDVATCQKMFHLEDPSLFNYYAQNGYFNNLYHDENFIALLSQSPDFKHLKLN